MKRRPLHLAGCIAAVSAAALSTPLAAATITWDNSGGTGAWSTAANWDTAEPTAADDVIFPAGLGGSITLGSGENAKSLQFDDTFSLSLGTLALATGSTVAVAGSNTVTITSAVTANGGTVKNGTGRLTLGGANTFNGTGGMIINEGVVRVAHASAIGAAANAATVNSGATLEVGVAAFDRPIALNNGGTVAGTGSVASNGILTISAGAINVSLGTLAAGDVLTLGNAANDLTGGSAATVIGISGPGSVRLAQNSNFDGTWNIPAGTRLDLGSATAAGDTPASGITLTGGTLAGRASTGAGFTASQANTLTVTADSTILSDRSSVTAGLTYTFGTLAMGGNTLTVAPGANATSGTAGITLGNVTLTGNPTFAVNDNGATNGKLTTGSLLGGGLARTIVKSGAGDLSLTGGSTNLPAGSQFAATGGGVIELLYPALGAGASVTPSAAQHPLGDATISITDGALRLLADGDGTTTVQTFHFNNPLTLGGSVILDPDRRSGSNTNKTFQFPGLTLAPGTALTAAGDNTYGMRVAGPLALQGSATLQGSAIASKNGLLSLEGGITGGAGSDTLTLLGGTSPLMLTLTAPGSFPGSTLVNGATVTANAAAAFGSGATTVSGGLLTINTDGALAGTVTLTGGTLRVNDSDALAANPVALNGGTLDLRSNTSVAWSTGALTLGGNATLNVANNGSGSSQVITVPVIGVSGNRTLTLTNANSFAPLLSNLTLAGDLTVSNAITARSNGISQDASPRKLLKAGTGQLELEAAGTHSGGTEVLAGTLLVEHADALGSGNATLGDTSGTAAATLRIGAGLTVNNDITVRAGSSGAMTIATVNPSNATLTGDITLQRPLTLDGIGTSPFTFSGRITGPFDITRTGSGPVVLTNGLNDFGTGGPAALNITGGVIAAGSDTPLGNGGITVANSSSTLRITETFATSRLLTLGLNARLEVDPAKIFTLNTALPADVIFDKAGTGTLAFGPSAVSTRTAGADVVAGTLRLTGAHGLSTGGVITMSNGTQLELLNDTNTAYPQTIASTSSSAFTIHTDRAEGGSATGGLHTVGLVTLGTGTLTHTSANGFRLTTGAVTSTGTVSVVNDAAGLLTIPSFGLGGTTASARTLTMETNGADIRVTGPLTQTGTPAYNLTKRGALTLRLDAGMGLTGAVSVLGGILDLQNNSVTLGSTLTLAGESPPTPVMVQSGTGTLTLGGNVTYTSSFNPPTAVIAGAGLNLGAADRTFTVNNSTAAAADLEITSPIAGTAGLTKAGVGTLRLSGTAGNTFTGLTSITDGTLELGKSAGNAIGPGGLVISGTSAPVVTLTASHQIADTAPVTVNAVSTSALLNLAGFAETTGPVTIQSTDTDGAAIATGAAGALTLNGNLTLANNRDISSFHEREVLVTGTGTEFVTASDGTLDLGGANRTVNVVTTVVSVNAALCNATIETRVINGGLIKPGRVRFT